jgi:hypothetical protein
MFLIHVDWRVVVTTRDATDNIVHDAFNTWFSSFCSSFNEVGEAQCLDNAMEKDEVVYHSR